MLATGLALFAWAVQASPGSAQSRTVGIRTEITPKEAQIYVDGFFSGTAGDFGGLFKRLRVQPGQHEIVLYLKGYKTIRQTLDVKPGSDYTLRQKLQPLAAGESSEPPPTAAAPAEQPGAMPPGGAPRPVPAPGEEPPAPRPPRPPRPPRAPRQAPEAEAVPAGGFGSLAIRVQPAGADILVDGERWQGPEGAGPLVIQVAEGTHRIEIRKVGYVPFSTEVQVRQGATSPVNVSLPEGR
jgi:hypothetical protein